MRKAAWVAAILVAVLGMVFLKVHLSGVKEYDRARQDLAAGRTWEAIHGFDRALHWYTPVSGYVPKAAEGLWAIGRQAEERGDVEQALIAYRTLRSGFYAARSFYTPGKDWIARCDERIAALAAGQPDFARRNADLSDEQRRAVVARSLARDRAPDVFWSIVVEAGFFGWIGCTVGFLWFVLGAKEGWNRRRAALWGLAVAGCYALWIVGMMRA